MHVRLIIDEIQSPISPKCGNSSVSQTPDLPALRQRVLDHVYAEGYRPSKPKEIHRALKLADDDYRFLRKVIKRMVIDGEVAFASNHLVVAIPAKSPAPLRPRKSKSDATEQPPENLASEVGDDDASTDAEVTTPYGRVGATNQKASDRVRRRWPVRQTGLGQVSTSCCGLWVRTTICRQRAAVHRRHFCSERCDRHGHGR